MKRAIGLVRVSSEDQKDEGYGIPEQVEKITEYMEARGYVIADSAGFATEGIDYQAGFFQEDYTGSTPFRPAVLALQEAIQPHNIQVVVIHRTNRLGRRGSVQQVLEADLRARGVKVEYVTAQFDTDNHYGRFIRNVIGSVDELDYETIIHQLRNGREQAVKNGSIIATRAPYGYRVVKEETETGRIIRKLEIVPEEAEYIRRIFHWYVYGDESGKPIGITTIAQKLSEMRVPTRWHTATDRRGKVGLKKRKYTMGIWDKSTIRIILHSETYIGRWAWGKTKTVPVPGTEKVKYIPSPKEAWIYVDVPAIIDDELFQAAQARTEENSRLNKRHKKYTYLFSGMLTCGYCGKAYLGSKYTPTAPYHYRCGGKRYGFRYTATRNAVCEMPRFDEDAIDNVIWPWIKEIVSNPEKVEQALDERQRESEEQNKSIVALVQTADRIIGELKTQQDRVMDLYKRGLLDADRWQVEDKALQHQMSEQQVQQAKLLSQVVKPLYSPEYMADIKKACSYIAEGIEHMTRDEKREVYELLCLTAKLTMEDGERVVNAECILDARRLAIKAQENEGGEGDCGINTSSTHTPRARTHPAALPRSGRPRAAARTRGGC